MTSAQTSLFDTPSNIAWCDKWREKNENEYQALVEWTRADFKRGGRGSGKMALYWEMLRSPHIRRTLANLYPSWLHHERFLLPNDKRADMARYIMWHNFDLRGAFDIRKRPCETQAEFDGYLN